MHTLNIIFYCAAATSIIALPFLLVNWARYMKQRSANNFGAVQSSGEFPIKSVSFFVIPILIAGAIASVMTTSARDEALSFIQDLSGNYTVYVNQQPARDTDRIISSLKGITPYWAHHSHPTKRIRVDIRSDKGNLTLELGRDSGDPREYWVFYTEHGVTSNNEIGRITTSAFDEY